MKYLNIALAKGRLAKQAADLFAKAVIDTPGLFEDTRKLITTHEENQVLFFLVKPSDVPTYIEYGARDNAIC